VSSDFGLLSHCAGERPFIYDSINLELLRGCAKDVKGDVWKCRPESVEGIARDKLKAEISDRQGGIEEDLRDLRRRYRG
jgi:hypothetical protein